MTTSKERPILFSAPMVRALRNGTKTQTRRIIKVPSWSDADYMPPRLYPNLDGFHMVAESSRCLAPVRCPQPGDQLYVREAWRTEFGFNHLKPSEIPFGHCHSAIYYEADGIVQQAGKYRHARFMCQWMSRIMLEVTEVRVQRLQDISEEDAVAEGLHVQIGDTSAGHMWNGPGYHDHVSFDRHGNRTYHVAMANRDMCICHVGRALKLTPARCAYRLLWEAINGDGSWAANPWVWAVTVLQ